MIFATPKSLIKECEERDQVMTPLFLTIFRKVLNQGYVCKKQKRRLYKLLKQQCVTLYKLEKWSKKHPYKTMIHNTLARVFGFTLIAFSKKPSATMTFITKQREGNAK